MIFDYKWKKRRYNKKISDLEKEKKLFALKQEVIELEDSMKTKKKKIPTSKILITFIFANLVVVEFFAMFAMWFMADLSSLPTLITCVIGEVVAYAIYSLKSMKENTMGGITYDTAIQKLNTETSTVSDSEAVG